MKDLRGDWLDVHEEERRGRALAEAILTEGQHARLTKTPDLLPSWYNQQLLQSGQKYFRTNLFSACVAMFHGLLVILAVPSILNVLIRTNKSSAPYSSYKRYMSTIYHVLNWYDSDFTNPNSKGRQSIREVKAMHAAAGTITQKDMALTQFGFMGFAILLTDTLGFRDDKLEGFVHFWRVVGHLLGIEERFNLCQGSVECTRVACDELRKKAFGPWMDKPSKQFDDMATVFVKGMAPVVPLLNPKSMIELTRRFCGLNPNDIPLIPKIILNYQLFVLGLLKFSLIAAVLLPILNFNMWLTFFLQKHAPVVAYFTFKADVRKMY